MVVMTSFQSIQFLIPSIKYPSQLYNHWQLPKANFVKHRQIFHKMPFSQEIKLQIRIIKGFSFKYRIILQAG